MGQNLIWDRLLWLGLLFQVVLVDNDGLLLGVEGEVTSLLIFRPYYDIPCIGDEKQLQVMWGTLLPSFYLLVGATARLLAVIVFFCVFSLVCLSRRAKRFPFFIIFLFSEVISLLDPVFLRLHLFSFFFPSNRILIIVTDSEINSFLPLGQVLQQLRFSGVS